MVHLQAHISCTLQNPHSSSKKTLYSWYTKTSIRLPQRDIKKDTSIVLLGFVLVGPIDIFCIFYFYRDHIFVVLGPSENVVHKNWSVLL